MRLRAIPSRAVVGALLGGLVLLGASTAIAKPRSVLILPFAPMDLGRDEQWLGEAVAESLGLALLQVPALVQIDRGRLKTLPQPESWTEQSALSAARALSADVALYGEVRRSAGDLSILPRFVEVKGDQGTHGTLEAVAVPEGALLERLKTMPLAYLRALKVPATDAEIARVQKYAAPTGSARAYEAYIKGQISAQRGTQEGNEAAVDLLGRAVELDPQFVVSQYGLGVVHQTLGNRWKAAAQFRASTQLDPTYPEPYKALGDLFLTAPRRLFDQAIEAYNKALELRPYFADAYAGLGDASAAKGDVNAAVAAYQKALVHNPLNPRVYVSLGKIYYGEKQLYFEAVTAYKKAVELDPRYIEARMGLAEVYEDKGLYQDAIGEYRKVVDQDDKNTGALYNLALVYEKVDPKEAISLWERYIALAGPQPTEKDWVDVARLHLRKLKSQYKD
ncbi:MAG TPA: tetratricopeptide repeat protein [Candidatus Nitrosocosmicus sp.]|jgi:tetratricopeptide (TPR) repeat protein/TolB-like protein|nr:tetratricopeptide repeat protein [Candidatus Nitrosocosmicus sp.]